MTHWLRHISKQFGRHPRRVGRGGPFLTGLFIIIIAVMAGIGFSKREQGKAEAQADPEIRVLVARGAEVRRQATFVRTRTYLGMVEPIQTSQVGFELAGGIEAIRVREGEALERGQVIAELDTDRLEAARREAEAALAEAEAGLRLAETTLGRTESARRLNAISVQQLDEARRNRDMQAAMVKRVQAQLDRIDVDLAKSRLEAPYSGIISRRFVDEGTVVKAGQPVLEMMETGATEIRVGLNRVLAATLTPGDLLEAEVNGTVYPITVERILPGRETATRTVAVIAILPQPNGGLRAGDLVTVHLQEEVEREGFWLPVDALVENARGLWSCFVAEPLERATNPGAATHRLTRRDLEMVAMDSGRVYVSGGLLNGDRVVTKGLHRFVPDQRIRLETGLIDSNGLYGMAD